LKRLGLSNNEAFHRITAARLARRFPVIFEMLERRDVHLTAVCLLRDYLTPDNHAELLVAVIHKTKLEIEQLLAHRFPGKAIPERLRQVQLLAPLSDEQYHLHLTLSRAAKEKLERARDLMSHANPSADLAIVVERALEVLVERLEARRFAQTKSRGRKRLTDSPQGKRLAHERDEDRRGTNDSADSQREKVAGGRASGSVNHDRRQALPSALRREVVARDGAQCTFIGDDGQRCDARSHLQFHHEEPWALGGADAVENVRLLCRAHNLLVAERELGARRVAAKVALARSKSAA
jgi:hypothetical protein